MTHENILIVDDSLDSQLLLKTFLEEGADYVCHMASSGDEALQVLATRAIDLALLDVVMPGMTGLTLFRRMREVYPDVAVIFVTAMDDLNLAVEHIKNGAYDYVIKPVAPARLQRVVREALTKRKAVLEENQYRRRLEEGTALRFRELDAELQEFSSTDHTLHDNSSEGLTTEEAEAAQRGVRGPVLSEVEGTNRGEWWGGKVWQFLVPQSWKGKPNKDTEEPAPLLRLRQALSAAEGMPWGEAFGRASRYLVWLIMWAFLSEGLLVGGVIFLTWGIEDFESRKASVALGIGLLVWGLGLMTVTGIALWIKASTDALADHVERRIVAHPVASPRRLRSLRSYASSNRHNVS